MRRADCPGSFAGLATKGWPWAAMSRSKAAEPTAITTCYRALSQT